jgi:diguanylate cyclase (GGDEF)-like protein
MVSLAVVALTLPREFAPRLAMLAPIAYFVAALGDLATAAVLLATWRLSESPRSAIVLALAFACNGLLVFIALVTLPLIPNIQPILDAPPHFGVWIYLFWHVVAAMGACAYVASRLDSAARPSRRFIAGAVAAALIVVAIAFGVAYGFSGSLPSMTNGTSISGTVGSGIGPAIAGLVALAALLVALIGRKANPIDRAFGYAMVALAIEITLFMISGHRYSTLYYVGRVYILMSALFVLSAAVRTLVRSRSRLFVVEQALNQMEDEATKRAGRVRALWTIASNPGRSDGDRLATILETATAAMRPGKPMLGLLAHLDGSQLVIDATAWSDFEEMPPGFAARIHAGAFLPFERSLAKLLRSERHASAWNDLMMSSDGSSLVDREMLWHEFGFRSCIGVAIAIATKHHFVFFASTQPMDDQPFAPDDIAYVDVVASFFSHQFAQQWQHERIKFQIEHDGLTGLENRVQFRTAVRNEIAAGKSFAVAFIDLDGFRFINEREGHQLGDELLVEVAASLSIVAEQDLVARMSADEFGVLLRGVDCDETLGPGLKRYADVFTRPFNTGDRTGTRMLPIGASIGAACYPDDAVTAEDLMRRAGVALDVAKSRGGATALRFDPPMEAILEDARLRAAELADAIANDELAVVYQPTFDLATRRVVGAEALVRWDHPTRGRLAPAEFIETAHRNNLIGPLTMWVFRRVLRDLSGQIALPADFRLSFNVAAPMLEDIPFITELSSLVRSKPHLVAHLGIEVTETAAMENVERSVSTIDLFRSWGIHVAIDDFGTGYSSLSYLKQLTVDMIKIDRSFVMGLPGDERDAAIIEMLLHITDRFGLSTLAEGIETEEQAAWLLQRGCRFGQGYLIARPHSFEELIGRIGATPAMRA